MKNKIINFKYTTAKYHNKTSGSLMSPNNFISGIIYEKQRHPFHIVDPSPWPFLTAISALQLVLGFVLYFQYFLFSKFFIFWAIIQLGISLSFWFRDIIVESTYLGCHTDRSYFGLKLGFALFILSEIMFFFSFFWSFFHFSLSPSIFLGCTWPPLGINPPSPKGLPLLNTVLLVVSGISITSSHRWLLVGNIVLARKYLIHTIVLGSLFTLLQFIEYNQATFSINDSVYGSIFYLATGFHGIHVLIGTIFILVSLFRLDRMHFRADQHLGFELSAWYWHFVDAVWLFLFICVYCWGSRFFSFFDSPENWQIYFQDPASILAAKIYNFHDLVMGVVVFVITFVFSMIFIVVDLFRRIDSNDTLSVSAIENIYKFSDETFFKQGSNKILSSYNINFSQKQITHNSTLEIIWTIVPALLLLSLVTPSFYVLYLSTVPLLGFSHALTIRIIGHQWYWSYYYPRYLHVFSDPNWFITEDFGFDSYMKPLSKLTLGHYRLLEVDQRLVIPKGYFVRCLVSSDDVIHSFAVPSFAVKTDAVPGRLNEFFLFADREGTFYGQCSEICGANHSFMPIVVDVVNPSDFWGN